MNLPPFHSWLRRRTESATPLLPESDKVMLVVAQAGPQGITRYKLGRAIKLEPDALNDLLDALVGSGLLTRTWHGEIQVFHARGRATSPAHRREVASRSTPTTSPQGNVIVGERDEKNTDNESGGKKQPPLDDYDRLVQGCEEFYFGPGAEPEGEKKPTPKTTDEESPKDAADEG